jgi:diguanylate cyclase (GGDEF)-like protein
VANRREPFETYLPLILSLVAALCIVPFAILWVIEGRWSEAIIDGATVVAILGLGYAIYRVRHVRYASVAVASICMLVVVVSIYISGPAQIYWTYPAMMAAFYLLRPNEALLLTLTVIAALIPAYMPFGDRVEAITVFMTIVLMTAIGYAFSVIMTRQREVLMELAAKDPLTGVGNRRAMYIKLDEIVNRSRRQPVTASVIMLDLDHFKAVNDTHGHATGDLILKKLTEIINLRIRITDSLFRVGGEEFVIVLDGQDQRQAQYLAEQLRTLVEANELAPSQGVTISLGVAELATGEETSDWLDRADQAMYDAKNRGRNITRIASWPIVQGSADAT